MWIYRFLKTFALVLAIMQKTYVGSPFFITKDGFILDGHTRYQIAKAIGMKEVPVVRLDVRIETEKLENLRETY